MVKSVEQYVVNWQRYGVFMAALNRKSEKRDELLGAMTGGADPEVIEKLREELEEAEKEVRKAQW